MMRLTFFLTTLVLCSPWPVALHAQPAMPAVQVEVHTAQTVPFAETIKTVGTLRANEAVTIVAESPLRLKEIAFEEGAQVAAGTLLFQLDDAELQSELKEIEARLALALANKKRTEELLPTKAVSQFDADLAAAEWQGLEAQKQKKLVQIARAKIIAPFAGKLGTRKVSTGALLSPNLPLVDLQDTSKIKVDFTVPERYARSIREKQKFSFTVAGQGEARDGVITVIEPVIDPQTRSLRLSGVCDKPEGLWPGGFADVTITLDQGQPSIMIPTQAVVPSPRGHGVYLIASGKAKFQEVVIGTRTDQQVQILRGVAAGDVIAITNLNRIRPGVEVKLVNVP